MFRSALNLALVLASLPVSAQVPEACHQFRREITRSAWQVFGPGAPVATLAAQIQQESACNPRAVSHAGAQGLTQFMPKTAEDMARLHSACSPVNAFDPRWAINCRDRYMRSLLKASRPMASDTLSECDAWAFALKAYNGGGTWVTRDRQLTHRSTGDPDNWIEVNRFNAGRRESAHRENREYPLRIFRTQHRYTEAGWGRGVCEERSQ